MLYHGHDAALRPLGRRMPEVPTPCLLREDISTGGKMLMDHILIE
jgi:hypothetical protein